MAIHVVCTRRNKFAKKQWAMAMGQAMGTSCNGDVLIFTLRHSPKIAINPRLLAVLLLLFHLALPFLDPGPPKLPRPCHLRFPQKIPTTLVSAESLPAGPFGLRLAQGKEVDVPSFSAQISAASLKPGMATQATTIRNRPRPRKTSPIRQPGKRACDAVASIVRPEAQPWRRFCPDRH